MPYSFSELCPGFFEHRKPGLPGAERHTPKFRVPRFLHGRLRIRGRAATYAKFDGNVGLRLVLHPAASFWRFFDHVYISAKRSQHLVWPGRWLRVPDSKFVNGDDIV